MKKSSLRLFIVSTPVAGMILVIGCASQPAKTILNDPGQRPSSASRNANSWEAPATAFEESFGIGDRTVQSTSMKNDESMQGHKDHKMKSDMDMDMGSMNIPQDMEHSQMKASDMEAEEPPMNHQQHQHGDH